MTRLQREGGKEKRKGLQLEYVRDSFCLLYHHFLVVLTEEILMRCGDCHKSVILSLVVGDFDQDTPDGLHVIGPATGKRDVSLCPDPKWLPNLYFPALSSLHQCSLFLSLVV